MPASSSFFSSKQSGERGVRVRVYPTMSPLEWEGLEYMMSAERDPVLGTRRPGALGTEGGEGNTNNDTILSQEDGGVK